MKTVWTVIIVILALVVLGYGGYRVYHHYTWKPTPAPVAMMQKTPSPASATDKSSSSATEQNSIFKAVTDPKLGSIMADPKGMTLYTYTKDTKGVSNCSGGCLSAWPAYSAPTQKGTFPANISVIKRTDGTFQYVYKEMPLYYFVKDKKPGDVTGQGVGGIWWVVKL